MRTQIIGTRDMGDKRNGCAASVLHGVQDVTEFLSRMGRETAATGVRLAETENETRPRYSAFLSGTAWITTGTFQLTTVREKRARSKTDYEAFLATASWLRTGAFILRQAEGRKSPHGEKAFHGTWITTGTFQLTTLREKQVSPSTGYEAFLSAARWISTGVFGLCAFQRPAAALFFTVFDGTWMTTGEFAMTGQGSIQAEMMREPLRLAA